MIDRSKQILSKLIRESIIPLSDDRRRMNEKEKAVAHLEAELEEARERFIKAQDEYHQEFSALIELIQLSEFPVTEESTIPAMLQAFRVRQSNEISPLMWDILRAMGDE